MIRGQRSRLSTIVSDLVTPTAFRAKIMGRRVPGMYLDTGPLESCC